MPALSEEQKAGRSTQEDVIIGKSLLFLYPCFRLSAIFCCILIPLFLPQPCGFSAELPSPYAIESLTGQKAPDFSLQNPSGRSVTLSFYSGKLVILVFWASWCPPCKDELHSLNRLYGMYKDRGLVVLAVSSDRTLSAVKEFVAQTPLDFEVLFDSKLAVTRDLYKAFMVPTSFVIDRRGIIFKKHFGEQDWTRPELVREIEALL